MESPTILHTFDNIRSTSLCFSPDGNILCTVGDDYSQNFKIKLWSISTKELISEFSGHNSYIRSCDYARNRYGGSIIATGSDDEKVMIWQPNSEDGNSTVLSGHSYRVESVRFNNEGSLLLSTSYDESVKIWDIEKQKEILTFTGCHYGSVHSGVFLDTDKTIVTGGGDLDGELKIWDLKEKDCICTFGGDCTPLNQGSGAGDVLTVSYNPSGFIIASGNKSGRIKFYDVRTYKLIHSFSVGKRNRVSEIDFHPSGKYLVSGSKKGMKLFNVEQKVSDFSKFSHQSIKSNRFSPDGKYLGCSKCNETYPRNYQVVLWETNMAYHTQVVLDLLERVRFVQIELWKISEEVDVFFTLKINNLDRQKIRLFKGILLL